MNESILRRLLTMIENHRGTFTRRELMWYWIGEQPKAQTILAYLCELRRTRFIRGNRMRSHPNPHSHFEVVYWYPRKRSLRDFRLTPGKSRART